MPQNAGVFQMNRIVFAAFRALSVLLCFIGSSQVAADDGVPPEARPGVIGCLDADYESYGKASEHAGEEQGTVEPYSWENLEPIPADNGGLPGLASLEPWYPTKIGQFYSQGSSGGCFTISLLNANISSHPFIDGWPVNRGYGRLFRYFMDCVTAKIGSDWGDGVGLGTERFFDILECKKEAVKWLLHRDSEISTHVLLYNGFDYFQTPPPVSFVNYHQSIKSLCWEMKAALEQDGAADGKTGAVQLFLAYPEINPDGSVAENPDGSANFSGGHAVAVSHVECAPVMRMTLIDSNQVQSPRHVTVNESGMLDPSGFMITGANIETNSTPLGTNPL